MLSGSQWIKYATHSTCICMTGRTLKYKCRYRPLRARKVSTLCPSGCQHMMNFWFLCRLFGARRALTHMHRVNTLLDVNRWYIVCRETEGQYIISFNTVLTAFLLTTDNCDFINSLLHTDSPLNHTLSPWEPKGH